MAESGRGGAGWKIVVGVGVALGVVCCGGVVAAVLFVRDKAQEIATGPGGVEGFVRDQVQKLAGARDTEAQDFSARLFAADADLDALYARTSPVFRGVTDAEGLATLHRTLRNVLGDLVELRIRNYNQVSRFGTASGTAYDLTYDATFTKATGTATIRLVDGPGGTLLVESFRVDSPAFAAALAGLPEPPAESPESDGADDGR